MTARAIGQLALAERSYTAEYVEFEVKRALEWISGNERKRLAAVSHGFLIVFVCGCISYHWLKVYAHGETCLKFRDPIGVHHNKT